MNFSVNKNVLRLGAKKIEFPFKISHTEKFGEVILVITDYHESNINENVWGVNRNGEIIWQIPKVDQVEFEGKQYLGINDPYTEVYKVDEKTARLFNWEGGYFEIDPLTGKFTKNILEFRNKKRPW
ncbi:hypothetical protein ACI6PS_05155 [Flavobacterium sp. PLA-1-15]|uniref:hypothetical protein n=1 Tax=Flavobacterium sp. PLA-1-15 TaxID=3380533 RepID=UPI003B790CCD